MLPSATKCPTSVLSRATTAEQHQPGSDPAKHEVDQSRRHDQRSSRSNHCQQNQPRSVHTAEFLNHTGILEFHHAA